MSNRVDHPQDKLNALAIAEANKSSEPLSWCLHDDGTMTIVTNDKGKIKRQPIPTRYPIDGSEAPGVVTPGTTDEQTPKATPRARTTRK